VASADAETQQRSITNLSDQLAGSSNIRALVVEDNPINQKVAQMMLGKLGVRSDVAANGREGVEMLELLPFDIVFMDCQMPEMNGYEAAAAIRRLQGRNRRVPIVAMTAEALTGSRERCLEAGMDDFITKPIKMDDLVQSLNNWLPRHLQSGLSSVLE
jgi:CheY-like chemotaxis protein